MIQITKEHLGFRQQLFQLAKADLVKTYRGAALGWVWAIIKPLTMIGVFWFVLDIGLRAGRNIDGIPFFLWLVLGLVPWFYISDMLNKGTGAIKKYRYLVTKMKFPVSTIPTFVSMSNFFVHLIMLIVVVVLLAAQGYAPSVYYLQLPFYLLLLFWFFTMWSLFAATLAAISKDFQNLVKSLTRILFWMSGIIYSIGSINADWLRNLLMVNPISFFVEGYRKTFLYKEWFYEDMQQLLVFLAILALMTLLATATYNKFRKELVDVL